MNDKDWRQKLVVPAFCPVCEGIMKGDKSTFSFYDFGCCQLCFIEFIEDREERWREGWRPDSERLEIFKQKYSGKT